MFILTDVTCANGALTVDSMIPSFVSNIINVFQLAIPIILIILGMIDLGKAVMSNDEKEMKGAQSKLIKRIIYAVLVFFIIAIVKFVFNVLDDSEGDSYIGCIDCFLNYSEENCK